MEIGDRLAAALRSRRTELCLTQEQMAERCEISARHYNDLENGRGNPRLTTLYKLVKGCGLRLDEIMEGAVP